MNFVVNAVRFRTEQVQSVNDGFSTARYHMHRTEDYLHEIYTRSDLQLVMASSPTVQSKNIPFTFYEKSSVFLLVQGKNKQFIFYEKSSVFLPGNNCIAILHT